MTDLHSRRSTPFALLILVSGAAVLFYSQSTASEQLGVGASSRRTAAGRQAAGLAVGPQDSVSQPAEGEQVAAQQSVPSPRALRDRSNRTPFTSRTAAQLAAQQPTQQGVQQASPQAAARTNALRAGAPRVVAPQTFAMKPQPAGRAPQLLDAPASGSTAQVAPLPAATSELPIVQELPSVQELVAMQPSALPPANPAPGRLVPPAPQRSTAEQLNELPPPNPGTKKPARTPGDDLPPFIPPDLTNIEDVTSSIAVPDGEMPRNFAAMANPSAGSQPLAPPDEQVRVSAPFYSIPRVPDFTYRPLYFEERALERNGRTIGVLQPGLSAAHFFGTIPLLPYKMGAQPPSRNMYTGDGIDPPSDHLSVRDRVRGVMAEAGVAIGLNYILP